MGPQDPRLSCPAERGRSAAKDKRMGSQYVAVCSVSNSPLTHNPFITLSQPFRIKCERYIFLKNCVRSSLLRWLCFRVYKCMFVYVLRLYNKRIFFLTVLFLIVFFSGCRGLIYSRKRSGIKQSSCRSEQWWLTGELGSNPCLIFFIVG